MTVPDGAVDVHAHVMAGPADAVPGAAYAPFEAPVEDYLRHLDALGVSRGVLVNPSTYGTDNTVLLDALRAHPGRLRGVAVIGPDVDDGALADLHDAGVRACRVQDQFAGGTPVTALAAVAERVGPLGWHVEVWTDPRRHLPLLRAAAGRGRILLDHLGSVPVPAPGEPDPVLPLLTGLLAGRGLLGDAVRRLPAGAGRTRGRGRTGPAGAGGRRARRRTGPRGLGHRLALRGTAWPGPHHRGPPPRARPLAPRRRPAPQGPGGQPGTALPLGLTGVRRGWDRLGWIPLGWIPLGGFRRHAVPRCGMRTQVGIVGAGPAGLVLAQILACNGIESVVVEGRSREYVQARQRAGLLEQGTVDLLRDIGVGERLDREGLRHDGVYLQWPGTRQHFDFPDLCGRSVWVYAQTEVVKDLVAARTDAGHPLYFEVSDTSVHDVETDRPSIRFVDGDGTRRTVECDLIAGCDGFHGISRPSVPADLRQVREREYPHSWLGILAEVPPSTDDLVYAWHPNGFALHSMRSHSISRLYIEVAADEDVDDWSDDRVWDELSVRMALDGWELKTGPVLEKGITPMRSFVSTPMRHGRLFLAGDAAHIVPPTGAKGLNLAVADVTLLARAIVSRYADGSEDLLDAYSDSALRRVWRCTHFSWWMTSMMHVGGNDPFDRDLQLAQLRYLASSRPAAESFAENYTGLPVGW